MNAINLLLPDTTPSKVWACGVCRLTMPTQADAEVCCTPAPCMICKEPTETLCKWPNTSAVHDHCRMAEIARREQARLEKAVKLDAWDGWVWNDGAGPNDGYFDSLDSFVDYLASEVNPDEWPEWVYVAESRRGVELDVGHILENECDDGYEDMGDDLKGVPELEAAVKAFNDLNADVLVYDGDWTRAVKVPRPEDVMSAEDLAEARAAWAEENSKEGDDQ